MKENNNLSLSDIDDSTFLRENESLLSLLLKDHTTGKNIKWGTDSYINHGYSFRKNQEIKTNLITGWYDGFIRPRVDKDINEQLERQRNRAEVFTPSWVIKLQVEAALEDMKELPLQDFIQSKWLEITCGEAPYMANRYDMETGDIIPLNKRSGFIDVKFKRLNKEIDAEDEWVKLALEIYKASYGYEYQGDSLLLARENLILTFIDNFFYMFGAFPYDKLLLEITKIVSLNVFQMDGLTYEVPYSDGGPETFGTQLSLFEEVEVEENNTPKLAKAELWGNTKTVDFKEIAERKDSLMKFDVVIGNPPYQGISNGGNKNYSKPIYPDFMDSAFQIGNKSILITPARFLFDAGGTKKAWNRKMLNDEHLKVIYYEKNSSNVFENTDIKGGVAVTYRDENRILGPIDTFIPYEELNSIASKIEEINYSGSLESIAVGSGAYSLSEDLINDFPNNKEVQSRGVGYGVKTNIFDKLEFIFHETEPTDDESYIQIFGRIRSSNRVYRWVKSKYINKPSNFNSWKVLVPHSNGTGAFGEGLSSPTVVGPNIGHTQTFMSFGSFVSSFEAESCLKYIKSKFARALLGILKVTQHNPPTTWARIPLQDFNENSDIDWSKSISEIDQQLYEKYNLSEDEIEFIETNVKEME